MRTQLPKAKRESDANAGLLLQRYVSHSADGTDNWSNAKRAILQAAIGAAKDQDVQGVYKAAYARWLNSLPAPNTEAHVKTAGRLIVGLGSENVLETGIRLHHTYGVPVIPGSALKGLAAHYCNRVWGTSETEAFKKPTKEADEAYRKFLRSEQEGKLDNNFHRLLFGNTDDSGCIVFHDAWFIPGSDSQPLRLDIITPHHPKWLDGSAPPTDFDSPTPVPFLSVTGSFHLVVSWQGPEVDESSKWLDLILSLFIAALSDWGVGGKTSSGYGQLERDVESEKRVAQENQREQNAREQAAINAKEEAEFNQRLESASPKLQSLLKSQRENSWQPGAGDQKMIGDLEAFANDNPEPPQDCLDFIRKWFESIRGYNGVWENPNAMAGKKKNKPKFKSMKIRELVKKLNSES